MKKEQVLILLAYATIYLVWGSTYLAIKFGIETFPPFLLMAVRFTISGALLLLFSSKKNIIPKKSAWRPLIVLSITLVVLGTGIMAYVEQFIPSGITALLVSITPVWMVFIQSLSATGRRPNNLSLLGVFIGLMGTALLINPTEFGGEVYFFPVAVLILSTLSWSVGSIYSSRTKLGLSPLHATSWQMLIGGTILGLIALFTGEFSQFEPSTVSQESFAALIYLIIFGSLAVFPTYMWLLQKSPPAMVATHAYVNPAVALFLGWLLLDEPVSLRTVFAASIIIGSIFLIGKGQNPQSGQKTKFKPRVFGLRSRRGLS